MTGTLHLKPTSEETPHPADSMDTGNSGKDVVSKQEAIDHLNIALEWLGMVTPWNVKVSAAKDRIRMALGYLQKPDEKP